MIQLNRTKINMILAKKDLTQEAVALKAHRNSGTIRNLFFRLKTNKSVRPCTAGLLARALGVSVEDIVDSKSESTRIRKSNHVA